jgi:hypothetical protein
LLPIAWLHIACIAAAAVLQVSLVCFAGGVAGFGQGSVSIR